MINNRNRKVIRISIILISLVIILSLLLFILRSFYISFRYDKAFSKIQIGTKIEEIIRLIGKPTREEEYRLFKFDLGISFNQRNKYKKAYYVYYDYPEIFKKRIIFFIGDKDMTVINKQKENLHYSIIVSKYIKILYKIQ